VDSTENPVTVTVDAPMSVVAEFVEVSAAAGLDLVADLGALLVATGDLVAAGDVTNLGFAQAARERRSMRDAAGAGVTSAEC
jgi:hypothetical protein